MNCRKRQQPLKSQIEVPWDPREDLSLPAPTAESTQQVSIEEIHLPQQQPRRYFDPQSQQQLIDSIQQHGILQPLLVRPLDSGGYELVAGERRYRAAREVGLTQVPVTVRELSDEAAFQLALIENLQREDLNPVEETEGILQLLAIRLGIAADKVSPLLHRLQKEQKSAASEVSPNVKGKSKSDEQSSSNNVIGTSEANSGQTSSNNVMRTREVDSKQSPSNNVIGKPELQIVEEVFNSLGLMTWESFINNRLPLLNLPQDILEALRHGKIAYTKARALAKVKDSSARTTLLKDAIDNNLSLSQIKEKILAQSALSRPQRTQVATEIPDRLRAAYQRVKKTRVWEDPKKCQQIDKLLTKLEALIGEE